MANDAFQDVIPTMGRDLGFYELKASSAVGVNARKLLHEYSKVPEDQIDSHVERIVGYAEHTASCIWIVRC